MKYFEDVAMDKYVILSKGGAFCERCDTIWGYITSEENARKVCNLWSSEESDFYYIKTFLMMAE